jgi:hypothetical protein
MTVKEKYCDPDIEAMVLTLRPYYLPREIPCINLFTIYIPPDANSSNACSTLRDMVDRRETATPEAVNIILGDFNRHPVKRHLTGYTQTVTCPTRGDAILDQCYINIKHAYTSKPKPPLGNSDHCMVHLIPTYKQKLKTEKTEERVILQWTDEAIDSLKGCFDCTLWDNLYDQDASLEHNIMVLTDYTNFCIDLNIPKKKITSFPNNKPWVTSDLKQLLNRKKRAISTKNHDELKNIKKDLRNAIAHNKKQYKDKIEDLFKSNDTSNAWAGLKSISGYKKKCSLPVTDDDLIHANELNRFFARFETEGEEEELERLVQELQLTESTSPTITEEQVRNVFKNQKIKKAAGPDGIPGIVIKKCADQLTPIWTIVFNQSLVQHTVPSAWKLSLLSPIPKIPLPLINNDLRPIALTDLLMKCLEKVFSKVFIPEVRRFFDPMQFAYQDSLCVEDAVLTFLNSLYSHLDKKSTYSRALFVDFSSAFNTISPLVLTKRLIEMDVNPKLILWTVSFLTNRRQKVRLRSTLSDVIVTNTGAPQGCVISPLLFTLYTSTCRSTFENCVIVKYADDTVILGNIKDEDTSNYKLLIENFSDWCSENKLLLNVRKTKEVIFDFRTKKSPHTPININEEKVDIVKNYKYLGVIIDEKLTWEDNTNLVCTKARKRLFFLRKLKEFSIDRQIMRLFYNSVIQSVLTFNITVWYKCLSVTQKDKISKVVKTASRCIGDNVFMDLDSMYNDKVKKLTSKIMENNNHPLNNNFVFLRSGIRLRAVKTRTKRFQDTFLPVAISIYNKDCTRR